MTDYIFDNLQILFIIAAVIFTLVKKAGEMFRKDPRPEFSEEEVLTPDAGKRRSTYETYRRSLPPPLDDQRTGQPPQRRGPPPMPRMVEAPVAELERQRHMEERLKSIRDTKATVNPRGSAKKKKVPAKAQAPAPMKLRDRLRDRKEIRRAMVMREILGPPVGLR